MTFVGVFFLTLVAAQPLVDQQHTALMKVYTALNCPTTNCERFGTSQPCSIRGTGFELSCVSGLVTGIRATVSGMSTSSSLATQIGQLTGLTRLWLSGWRLGSLPSELGLLAKLTLLDLSYSAATGQMPSGIARLSLLNELHLNDNNLSGTLVSLSQLSQLVKLDVSNNNALSGTLPTELSQLSRLDLLFVSSTQLSGAVPNLTNLSQLKSW